MLNTACKYSNYSKEHGNVCVEFLLIVLVSWGKKVLLTGTSIHKSPMYIPQKVSHPSLGSMITCSGTHTCGRSGRGGEEREIETEVGHRESVLLSNGSLPCTIIYVCV